MIDWCDRLSNDQHASNQVAPSVAGATMEPGETVGSWSSANRQPFALRGHASRQHGGSARVGTGRRVGHAVTGQGPATADYALPTSAPHTRVARASTGRAGRRGGDNGGQPTLKTPQPRSGHRKRVEQLRNSPRQGTFREHEPHRPVGRPLASRAQTAGARMLRVDVQDDGGAWESASTGGPAWDSFGRYGDLELLFPAEPEDKDPAPTLEELADVIWSSPRSPDLADAAEARKEAAGFNWRRRLKERPWTSASVNATHFSKLHETAFVPEDTADRRAPRVSLFLGHADTTGEVFGVTKRSGARQWGGGSDAGDLAGSMLSTDGDHNRRQYRTTGGVAARLGRAIEEIRGKPRLFRDLEYRVRLIKASRRARMFRMSNGRDLVQHNKEVAQSDFFTPECRLRRIADAARERERRVDSVLKASEAMYINTMARRMMMMEEHERHNERLLDMRRRSWLAIVAVTARFNVMTQRLEHVRRLRKHQLALNNAARRIAHCWRHSVDRTTKKRTHTGRTRIKKFFKVVMMAQRLVRAKPRHDAADTLVAFLGDYGDKANLLRKIVGQFVQRVVRAQRVCRTFLACRAARLEALGLYWDKIEVNLGGGGTGGLETVDLNAYLRSRSRRGGSIRGRPSPSSRSLLGGGRGGSFIGTPHSRGPAGGSTFITQGASMSPPGRRGSRLGGFGVGGSSKSLKSAKSDSFRSQGSSSGSGSPERRGSKLRALGTSGRSLVSDGSDISADLMPRSMRPRYPPHLAAGGSSRSINSMASYRSFRTMGSSRSFRDAGIAGPKLYNGKAVKEGAMVVSHRLRKLQKRLAARKAKQQALTVSKATRTRQLREALHAARVVFINEDIPKHRQQFVSSQQKALEVNVKEAALLVRANEKKAKHLVEKRFLNASRTRTPCPLFLMWKRLDKARLRELKEEAIKEAMGQRKARKGWRVAPATPHGVLHEEGGESDSSDDERGSTRHSQGHGRLSPRSSKLTMGLGGRTGTVHRLRTVTTVRELTDLGDDHPAQAHHGGRKQHASAERPTPSVTDIFSPHATRAAVSVLKARPEELESMASARPTSTSPRARSTSPRTQPLSPRARSVSPRAGTRGSPRAAGSRRAGGLSVEARESGLHQGARPSPPNPKRELSVKGALLRSPRRPSRSRGRARPAGPRTAVTPGRSGSTLGGGLANPKTVPRNFGRPTPPSSTGSGRGRPGTVSPRNLRARTSTSTARAAAGAGRARAPRMQPLQLDLSSPSTDHATANTSGPHADLKPTHPRHPPSTAMSPRPVAPSGGVVGMGWG